MTSSRSSGVAGMDLSERSAIVAEALNIYGRTLDLDDGHIEDAVRAAVVLAIKRTLDHPRGAVDPSEVDRLKGDLEHARAGVLPLLEENTRLRLEVAALRKAIADYLDDVIDRKALGHA